MDANGLRFWMLSQLNDWLAPWSARTVYLAGQGIVDANGNIQIVQTAGQSDAAQPAWNATMGQTTADGGIVWLNSGPGTWAPNTAFAVGQYILDSNQNLQSASAVTGPATTGAKTPSWPVTIGQTVSDGNVTWTCAGPWQGGLGYCNRNNRLELRSVRTGGAPTEDYNAARALADTVPMTLDQFGTYARWDQASGIIYAGGAAPSDAPPLDEVPILVPPQPTVTDIAMGYDGVFYVAVGGALLLSDRRNRWPDFTLTVPDFNFWRLAARPEGGVLALDRKANQLAIVAGQPLQTGPVDIPDPGILRSCQPNPDPPRIVSRIALPAGERFVALAPLDPSQQPAQYVLLSWAQDDPANQIAWVRIFSESAFTAAAAAPLRLDGVHFPYTIAGLGNQKLAALATNYNEALIYDLSNAGHDLVPAGETYVLGQGGAGNVGPFVHGFSQPPNYANVAGALPLMLPLLPLSLNSLAPSGATLPAGPAVIDSGSAHTVWHRLFAEAVIPSHCGALVWLAASDNQADLFSPSCTWYPHIFGSASLSSIPTARLDGAPSAAWQSIPTEVAYAPTLLGEDPIANTQGLFMVLIQRANKAVRNLSGRFLGIRIQLNGDGRNTPEIAGLRVYASRFSYVENYLPEIYREAVFGPGADADGPSTRPDFFERFLDLFEAEFTRIEDRVANAYLLMRAESVPDGSLGWLGSWIGIDPDGYPPDRLRARIEATPDLYRLRGTAQGITMALDVATKGMASRGAIIVIEDFRLRHLFATILGADLSISNNPLLPGYYASSNSIVGDTLFLGDPRIQAELQALYATNLNIPGSAQAVTSLYDQFANRITVFVHNQVENVNLNLVKAIVEAEKPAHVLASVLVASQPLMIGLASLLGVNTYLAPEPPRNTATIDVSGVGRYDVVTHMPSLDPRLENGISYTAYAQPIARIKAPVAVKAGDTILLDGSSSSAPQGTTITSFTWTLLPPPD
jgi:phage tail-like protein